MPKAFKWDYTLEDNYSRSTITLIKLQPKDLLAVSYGTNSFAEANNHTVKLKENWPIEIEYRISIKSQTKA